MTKAEFRAAALGAVDLLIGWTLALAALVAIVAVGLVVLALYEVPRRALEARERRRVQSIVVPR